MPNKKHQRTKKENRNNHQHHNESFVLCVYCALVFQHVKVGSMTHVLGDYCVSTKGKNMRVCSMLISDSFRSHSPIILQTENFLCFTGRPLESVSSRSNALYRLGVFSATDTSQKPIPCDAANEAPSVSATCKMTKMKYYELVSPLKWVRSLN